MSKNFKMGKGTVFIGDEPVGKLESLDVTIGDQTPVDPVPEVPDRITAKITVEMDSEMRAAIEETGRRIEAGERVIPIEEVMPTLSPEIMARRARIGANMRREHVERTLKTPGARRRQIRFKLFSSVTAAPLIDANQSVTLAGLIAQFRGHAMRPIINGETIPDTPEAQAPAANPLPPQIAHFAIMSFLVRKLIGDRARAANPKLPPQPPSEDDLDRADELRRAAGREPLGGSMGWRGAIGMHDPKDLLRQAFGGG